MDITVDFTGPAIRLRDEDYIEACTILDLEKAIILAVSEVEAAGDGFLPSTRPKILFESYQFHRHTKGKFTLTYPQVSQPRWVRDYAGGESEYDRLALAIELDRLAALKSTSWGRFQIMGFNYLYAGFDDVESMVQAHCKSEGEHLKAFVNFIKATKMDAPLREYNWAKFARMYNGPGYASNQYDTKLARAYARHKQILMQT